MTDRESFRDRVLAPRSSLAETAWMLSLVALATCGLFSPLALVVGLAALRGPDRRTALRAIGVALASAAILLAVAAWLARR